ncbi:MAG: hypothetical protein CMJ64_15080 [Planctomycetaceae bacterium]|nr:hypothetical protein [Planctomycetaceae bacterium]
MDRQQFRTKMAGNFIALPTPFHDDFSLDLETLRCLVRRLMDAGYRTGNGVLLVGGAAGEFATLRTEERKRVAEVVVEEAAGRIAVIVGAQDTSTMRVLELARFAESIGADGIQVGPPYYYPPSSEDIFALFQAISDEAAIPMVVYNTWWTGAHADLGYDRIAKLLDIANVGALKWSSPDAFVYEGVLKSFSDKIAIIDNQLCEILSHMMGAVGFVSHPPQAWPEYGLRLWATLEEGCYAEALGMLLRFRNPYYRLFFQAYEYSGSEGHFDKAILELVGERGGPPRPPGRPLPAKLVEAIRQMLLDAGVPGVKTT